MSKITMLILILIIAAVGYGGYHYYNVTELVIESANDELDILEEKLKKEEE